MKQCMSLFIFIGLAACTFPAPTPIPALPTAHAIIRTDRETHTNS
jgi:hypothetical protein